MSGLNWGAIKEIAYGPLNLTPDQLGTFTVGEIMDMYDGYLWRERRLMEQQAQLASWVTAPHLRKPLDPKKLMQPNKPKEKTTPKKTEKMIAGLKNDLGLGGF